MNKVAGVILAAGGSSRLGRPKQLLLLDGEPVVRIVTRNALASRLSDVVLVVGSAGDEVVAAVNQLGQRTVRNPDWASGQSSSLRAGLRAVPQDADAIVFLLGDQPETGAGIIDALIEEFERTGAAIVQPVYGEIPGNPILFSRSLFAELATVSGDEGARSILKRRLNDIRRLRVSDGRAPLDVDTDEDYEALRARWAEARSGG